MTWVKVDDKAPRHKKQLKAGAEACWLWVCGLAYAKEQPEHDGRIPSEAIAILYPFRNPAALAAKLVQVGLWEQAEDGYQIHDWDFWNGTPEEVAEKKQRARDRAAASYDRKRKSAAQTPDTSAPILQRRESAEPEQSAPPLRDVCADSSGSIPIPIPIPDPPVAPPPGAAPKRKRAKTEVQPIPADWCPPPATIAEIASAHNAAEDDIRYQADEFRAYWLTGGGAGERKANWLLAFRNRIHAIIQTGRRLSRPAAAQVGISLRYPAQTQPTTEVDPLEVADRLRRQREAERSKREIATPEQARAILAGAAPDAVQGAAQ